MVAATTAALGLSGLAAATTSSARPTSAETEELPGGRYIVLLDEPAAATYAGGIPGIAATRAGKGEKFNARSAAVREYRDLLRDRQATVANRVGATRSQSYTVANNGFAASLTSAQATELSSAPGVLAVVEDQLAKPDTTSSPEFLGLTQGGQAVAPWTETGAGKGVVVGVIDSGYWPESPSFTGTPMPTASGVSAGAPGPVRVALSKTAETQFFKADGGTFTGRCERGESFPVDTCNSKVVSADAFSEGFRSAVKRSDWGTTEYDSPRDGGGHGSHTGSTAAGNSDVDVTIDGVGFGKASGMAPAAKIAVYKVCWEAKVDAQTGCYNSDTTAAIDQSVADGVDVINYSISGTRTNVVDPVEIGYLNAAAAGIFVAASAGNSGPDASTVAHNSPWLTTVAASTHVTFEGTVVLGNGAQYKGASTTADGTTGSLVLSTTAGVTGATATQVRLCYPGTLDPAVVTGKIVVCDRGVIARVDKSAAVKQAGGKGMVLANTSPSSLDADLHMVPTVHVDHVAGAAIKAYVNANLTSATATLAKGNLTTSTTPVPQIAPFSSRGPAAAAGGDLLKPDITAPGVSVIAAVAPPSNSGRSWDFYSGTSMSSPHVAGLAAYYLSEFPTWSPMAVKSAMMTTAYDLKDSSGGVDSDPFNQGAGHVDPTQFFNPGVVFESDEDDWYAYIAGQGATVPSAATTTAPIDASDLNVASLAIGDLAGVQTVTREVTDVTGTQETYRASYSGSDAISVSFNSNKYTVPAGGTLPVTLTVKATGTSYGSYAKGFITLTGDKGHVVRIPVAVQPLRAKAPAVLSAKVSDGTATISGTAGFSGTLGTAVTGLVGVTPESRSVATGASQEHTVEVPANTDYVRFDVDAVNNGDDLDLLVYTKAADGTLTEVASSATGAADEQVSLTGPAAGTYVAVVQGYSLTTGSDGSYAFTGIPVSAAPVTPANLTLSPASQSVTANQPFTIAASWSLDSTKRYLGRIQYLQDGTPTGVYTVVSLTTG